MLVRETWGLLGVAAFAVMLAAGSCVLDRSGQGAPGDGSTTTTAGGGSPVGPGPTTGPGPSTGGSGAVGGAGGSFGGNGGNGAGGNSTGGEGGTLVIPPEIDINGLVFWHRADAGVSTAGSAVTGWADQSGNGHDAAQATSNARPMLSANAINGEPAIVFDGNNDTLTIADAADLDPGQGSFLYVAVGRWITSSAYNAWGGKTNGTEGTNYRFFRHPGGKLTLYYGVDGARYADSTLLLSATEDHVIGWGIDAATNELIYIVDGVERITIASVLGTGMNATPVTIGADAGGGYPSNIRVAEQVFYSRNAAGFADGELNALITLLRARYGI